MPRKSKKQRPSTTTSTTLATRRHWIYTTTDNTNSSSQYDSYLHQRVQRVLVRSVPSNFSYFNDQPGNNGEFEKNIAFHVQIYVWGGWLFIRRLIIERVKFMVSSASLWILLGVVVGWFLLKMNAVSSIICVKNQSLRFINSFSNLSFYFCTNINIAATASAAASGANKEDKSDAIVDESNEVRCKKYY